MNGEDNKTERQKEMLTIKRYINNRLLYSSRWMEQKITCKKTMQFDNKMSNTKAGYYASKTILSLCFW